MIKHRWFSRLQFKSLKIKPELFECYFIDSCDIPKKDMIAFMQASQMYYLKESISGCKAEVHIFVGEKEKGSIKKSAEDIHNALPDSLLNVLPKWHHGEFSINHGKEYATRIREIIGG